VNNNNNTAGRNSPGSKIGIVWRQLEKKTGGALVILYDVSQLNVPIPTLSACYMAILVPYISPIQLGVGIPSGCEAAVHATRCYIEAMPDDHVVAKVNFFTHSTASSEIKRVHTKAIHWNLCCSSCPVLIQF